jgi:hypothetical protein
MSLAEWERCWTMRLDENLMEKKQTSLTSKGLERSTRGGWLGMRTKSWPNLSRRPIWILTIQLHCSRARILACEEEDDITKGSVPNEDDRGC